MWWRLTNNMIHLIAMKQLRETLRYRNSLLGSLIFRKKLPGRWAILDMIFLKISMRIFRQKKSSAWRSDMTRIWQKYRRKGQNKCKINNPNFLFCIFKNETQSYFPGSVQATVQPDQQGEDVGPGDTGEGPGRDNNGMKVLLEKVVSGEQPCIFKGGFIINIPWNVI